MLSKIGPPMGPHQCGLSRFQADMGWLKNHYSWLASEDLTSGTQVERSKWKILWGTS